MTGCLTLDRQTGRHASACLASWKYPMRGSYHGTLLGLGGLGGLRVGKEGLVVA